MCVVIEDTLTDLLVGVTVLAGIGCDAILERTD